jgi:hypothetical protein
VSARGLRCHAALAAPFLLQGPLRIRVQEMDTYAEHDMLMETHSHRHDFNCRSKVWIMFIMYCRLVSYGQSLII